MARFNPITRDWHTLTHDNCATRYDLPTRRFDLRTILYAGIRADKNGHCLYELDTQMSASFNFTSKS